MLPLTQVVCNFAGLAGTSIILYNEYDRDRMKDVPMFYFSHLVMRIDVTACEVRVCVVLA